MKSGGSEVIDATDYGNLARFINHSWEPNCETQKWNVLGEIWVGIFTLRDIQVGEELTFDYQFDCYNTPYSRWYCGSDKCKGFLGIRPMNKDQEKELEDNLACKICKKVKDNDILPDGSKGIERVSLFTYSKTNRIENPMYILCWDCKYSFHTKWIKPKITKRKLLKDDFEFSCKSCKKKHKLKKRSRKNRAIDDESDQAEEEMEESNAKIYESTEKAESEKEMVIIKDTEQPSKSEKDNTELNYAEFKIIIDPNTLHDDRNYGGVERIEATMLKFKINQDSERFHEEHIDQDENSISQVKSDMQQESREDCSIIKIKNSDNVEVKKSNGDEEVIYHPEYARLLDTIVKAEFEQLEREWNDLEVKFKDAKRKKKAINFMYIFQKRLKKRISSRKYKHLSLSNENKGMF